MADEWAIVSEAELSHLHTHTSSVYTPMIQSCRSFDMATLEIIHTNLEDITTRLRPSYPQAIMDELGSTWPQMCERRSGSKNIQSKKKE